VGLTIWGRANSVNVQKALWCLAELDIAYERIDAGMAFGRNNEPDYLAMNPNGRVPTLVDGDFVLWESNSIMRYLCLAYGKGTPIYPDAPKRRAAVDRWLDWTLSTVQPVDRPVFWAIIRTAPEKQDWAQIQKDADAEAPVWAIADRQLSTRRFMEGDQFTIADIAVGSVEHFKPVRMRRQHAMRDHRDHRGPARQHPDPRFPRDIERPEHETGKPRFGIA